MERIYAEHPLPTIAHLMVKANLISNVKINEYQKNAQSSKQTLLEYLTANKLFSARQLALLLSEHFGVPYLDLDSINLTLMPWQLLNEKWVYNLRLIPLFIRGNHLFLATDDPSKHATIKEIQFYTQFYPLVIVVERDKLNGLIEKINQHKSNPGSYEIATTEKFTERLSDPGFKEDAPIVKLVHDILADAVKRKASDVHFELYEDQYRVRYRLDGVLVEAVAPPTSLANQITSRIKILANLDISERRIPQDGRFRMEMAERFTMDFRVNVCPTVSGEKIAIRILNPNISTVSIEELGFNSFQQQLFLRSLEKPQGMILITGPTGSGKTASLYTALTLLNTPERNILTAEDPVEIKISGINQININPKVGLTFANALRSFLRQDPDIIMVGEIRDLETAEIAIKASHTGHLVLSTLHTNSAAEALTRLRNMGVPSFNIASSLNLLIAQRLVRRLCSYCKKVTKILTASELIQLGFEKEIINPVELYSADGCKHCLNGYKGRIGLFEILPVSPTIADLILSNVNSIDILRQAKQEGMLTLRQTGFEKVRDGITTIEELNRVTIN
ncbi:type IV-A pilus assembly ATPase PilB [Legionella cardiaca]|uniref:Type IV-A pilus assembly ATPase PilB n=1 Tax=Legionella cardiaca TaxID=1071983 RepID=A0ABY8AUI7_9GAMM|nr:type IV-A pilus assembly ATPase PilB [Legionella cardiaca]WED44345.1 type IV-A pilus assembly ATPase PilB [Legionella cardiaca]